jgi:transcriptional regulator with XRE-family HTH domain
MRKSSPQVTSEMAAHIKWLRNYRGWLQHDIAALFSINQGRVSEICTGKRFPDVKPIPMV